MLQFIIGIGIDENIVEFNVYIYKKGVNKVNGCATQFYLMKIV